MNIIKTKKVTEPGNGFNSKGLGLRVQKKLASSMASKKIAKHFIDESTGQLLDDVYLLIKDYSGDKKQAEKIVKYLIKITIKVAIAMRNDQLSQEEIDLTVEFKRKFNQTIMTITSFIEVDFTFDRGFLIEALNDNRAVLHKIIERHTTDKTKAKLDRAFDFLTDSKFLDEIFNSDSKHRPLMERISKQLDALMEAGMI